MRMPKKTAEQTRTAERICVGSQLRAVPSTKNSASHPLSTQPYGSTHHDDGGRGVVRRSHGTMHRESLVGRRCHDHVLLLMLMRSAAACSPRVSTVAFFARSSSLTSLTSVTLLPAAPGSPPLPTPSCSRGLGAACLIQVRWKGIVRDGRGHCWRVLGWFRFDRATHTKTASANHHIGIGETDPTGLDTSAHKAKKHAAQPPFFKHNKAHSVHIHIDQTGRFWPLTEPAGQSPSLQPRDGPRSVQARWLRYGPPSPQQHTEPPAAGAGRPPRAGPRSVRVFLKMDGSQIN